MLRELTSMGRMRYAEIRLAVTHAVDWRRRRCYIEIRRYHYDADSRRCQTPRYAAYDTDDMAKRPMPSRRGHADIHLTLNYADEGASYHAAARRHYRRAPWLAATPRAASRLFNTTVTFTP